MPANIEVIMTIKKDRKGYPDKQGGKFPLVVYQQLICDFQDSRHSISLNFPVVSEWFNFYLSLAFDLVQLFRGENLFPKRKNYFVFSLHMLPEQFYVNRKIVQQHIG